MTKKEMALWYEAVMKASDSVLAEEKAQTDEWLDSWEAFFMEWCRQLFVEAGRPKGFPWRVK